jgi:uncharacterized membrane protein
MTIEIEDQEKDFCQICQQEIEIEELVKLELVQPDLNEYIEDKYPEIDKEQYICECCLNLLRGNLIKQRLLTGKLKLTQLDQDVIDSIYEERAISEEEIRDDKPLTLGEKAADKIASFGGSWTFVISFFVFLAIWICLNIFGLTFEFDKYPFILLNLILSCLAAIQAPIIMMSQNRQEAKDRKRSEQEYKINLKSELEILYIKALLEQFVHHHLDELMQIQRIQIEILEELNERKK